MCPASTGVCGECHLHGRLTKGVLDVQAVLRPQSADELAQALAAACDPAAWTPARAGRWWALTSPERSLRQ
jgi:hypothetical protein